MTKMPRKLSKARQRDWLACCRALRKKFPLNYPVEIRVDLPSNAPNHAICWRYFDSDKRKVTSAKIRIGRHLDYAGRIDALAHEYAHVMNCCYHGLDAASEHDECWGVLYSKCYRFLVDECNECW